MALSDSAPSVRKKAVLSLSSAVRNCSEALEIVLPELPRSVKGDGKVEADDMEALDEMFRKLRESIA
jgi:hsp70-interacting protein